MWFKGSKLYRYVFVMYNRQHISIVFCQNKTHVLLALLVKNSTDGVLKYCFYFFPRKRHFGDPLEAICMNCQILFSGKNKKKKVFQNAVCWKFYPECKASQVPGKHADADVFNGKCLLNILAQGVKSIDTLTADEFRQLNEVNVIAPFQITKVLQSSRIYL